MIFVDIFKLWPWPKSGLKLKHIIKGTLFQQSAMPLKCYCRDVLFTVNQPIFKAQCSSVVDPELPMLLGLGVKADRAKAKNINKFGIIYWMAPGPIRAKAKAKAKNIGRIVWMPIRQPTPKAKATSLSLLLSLGLLWPKKSQLPQIGRIVLSIWNSKFQVLMLDPNLH